MTAPENGERLLRPAEVAALFDVDPKTVAGWAAAGKLSVVFTLGGHRRYVRSEVLELRREMTRRPEPPAHGR